MAPGASGSDPAGTSLSAVLGSAVNGCVCAPLVCNSAASDGAELVANGSGAQQPEYDQKLVSQQKITEAGVTMVPA